MRLDLCGKWLLYDEAGKEYPATVPGCVHTDIVKEDLYWRDNSDKYKWIENHNWTYTREFQVDAPEINSYLVFEGLDTYCDILLNGVKVGHCENMFIPHRFPVDGVLRAGSNQLTVLFYSPIEWVKDKPERPAAFTAERLYTRRQQCTYGWDWVDRFVTCGICKPVYLEADNQFGVNDIYVYTDLIDDYGAGVRVTGTYKNYEAGSMVEIAVLSPEEEKVYSKRIYVNTADFTEYITIPKPQLWYPAGYGEQPLYTLLFRYEGGEFLLKFGIRTVRILEKIDEVGSPFYNKCLEIKDNPSAEEYDRNEEFKGFILLVNGVKILCMGANYVPVEPFVSAETPEKITAMLERAKAGGVNMVRVWGGGVIEIDHFYSECDRLGLMVLQDFLMACGHYPEEEEWFIEQLTLETEYAAKLLRNHPCLMWWHGDNENAVHGCDTDENYWGRSSAYKGMLPVLNKLDYSRRFLPSSPYGGDKYASKTVGTTHNSQYLGDYIFKYIREADMEDYKEYWEKFVARFITEEPISGASGKYSLLKIMTEEDIYDEEKKMWYYHTKTNPPVGELLDIFLTFAEKILGGFTDPADRLYKYQYLAYEHVRFTLENCRKGGWFCGGILYWMLNDCWPTFSSQSFIDYYNEPKAPYYSFRRGSKQVIASVDKKGIVLSNVGMENKTLQLKCRMIDYKSNEETVLLEQVVETQANECTMISWSEVLADGYRSAVWRLFDGKQEIVDTINIPEGNILICDLWEQDALYDRSFYKEGYLHMEPTEDVILEQVSDGCFRVTAGGYVQAVELEAPCVFDDNWFSLTKGESRTVKAEGPVTHVKVNAYRLK